MPKRKSYDQQFKEETIQYVRDHPEMSVKAIANELLNRRFYRTGNRTLN